MKLENIQAMNDVELWFEPTLKRTRPLPGLATFRLTDISGEYIVFQEGSLVRMTIRDAHKQSHLDDLLRKGSACLAHLLQVAEDGRAFIKIVFFNGPLIEWSSIDVGISDRVVGLAGKYGYSENNLDQLARQLQESCVLEQGLTLSEPYFVILAGAALAGEKAEDDDQDPEISQDIFEIQGENIRIPIRRDFGDTLLAGSLAPPRRKGSDPALRLVKGEISFSDFTQLGGMSAMVKGQLSDIVQDEGSYLRRWDEYGDLEGELLLEQARSIGSLPIKKVQPTPGGVKFFIQGPIPESIEEEMEIEITTQPPVYLSQSDLAWREYSALLEQESIPGRTMSGNGKSLLAKVKEVKSSSITLKSDDENKLPTKGYGNQFLILSIRGDEFQIKRRMKARKLILEGRSAMPQLGLLIEENGQISRTQRSTTVKDLTQSVWDKIFPEHAPTPTQRKAIYLALNTPDIMLIQGPPGTGKTTVITAIIERLNEEHDKSESIKGQVLVTAFQHDAVENMLSRLSINALPQVKFGNKWDKSEFTKDRTAARIRLFCQAIIDDMVAQNPELLASREQAKLAELMEIYSATPSNSNAQNIIQEILELPENLLTPKLISKGRQLMGSLTISQRSPRGDTSQVKLIRSMRISKPGFLDDGKIRVAAILEELHSELDESEIKILNEAITCEDSNVDSILSKLKEIKLSLLERYIPTPTFQIEKAREDILKYFSGVERHLKKNTTVNSKMNQILATFLHELQDNPHGARKAIEDYNYVFAATTQQSDGRAIKEAKIGRHRDQRDNYDTVIIDEAARVSPRDLLIPMAKAGKRIILVGDHRQLPHIINEDVIKELSENKSNQFSEDDYIKDSMFGYLKQRLEQLEKIDGTQRVITLDAQYRTHPVLGKFISDNFYFQPDGENPFDERFKSPLPADIFKHSLPGTRGKAALWLDVSKGEEKFSGASRRRPTEAFAIADQLAEWIDSEAGRELSFGVISFYSAQVLEIMKALRPKGLTKKINNSTYEITDAYQRNNKDGGERLRIGTVDAFQGMEFDVVFLSVVRSQNMDSLPPKIKKLKDDTLRARRLFGHLVSKNRLCVSMSRQKKILVVVGDAKFVQSGLAKQEIPALGKFLEICQNEETGNVQSI